MRPVTLYVFIILCAISLFIFEPRVKAQQLQSPRYRIESGTLSLEPDLNQVSGNYDLSSSFGPNSKKQFKEKGYVAISRVRADSSTKSHLRMQLSSSQLVFDRADIIDESIQKSSVTVTGMSSTPVILGVRQAEPFKNSFGGVVDSTQCDNKSLKCTPTQARKWKNAFGFGYGVNGSTFADLDGVDNFRPFYIGDESGKSAVVFRGSLDKDGKTLDLRFKLRPQPQAPTGIYMSTIIITATTDY